MILRCLTILLVAVSGLLAQDSEKRTLAVLDFSNNSIAQRAEVEPLSKALSDIFTTEFSRIDAFIVVERENIRKVITELQFQQTEFVDPKEAQKMGKLLGAEYLVLGAFVHSFGGDLRVDLRIVEVETGRTLRGEEATGDLDDLFDVVEDLAEKFTDFFDVSFPDGFDPDTGPASKKAALLFAQAVEHEDKAFDLIAAGNKPEATKSIDAALILLERTLEESPDFRDAADKMKKLKARKTSLR